MGKQRPTQKINYKKFIKVYTSSDFNFNGEVAEKMGLSTTQVNSQVNSTATKLRKLGVKMSDFNNGGR